ncbi:MAG: nucleotidyl transferase AbiEii/AbiGii toxin family protein [Candidatus Omnitrophota bacterium]
MDIKIRQAQLKILEIFSRAGGAFALAGGTALELYYLRHRFSVDLDFFSCKYDNKEIEKIVLDFKEYNKKIRLESEFISPGRAKVSFYTMPIKGTDRLLKIDFIEDNIFAKPIINKIKGIPVYSVENIYLQKLIAITGTQFIEDDTGRQWAQGRREARDVFDIYILSKKIRPLHIFLEQQSRQIQRGMVYWYQEFSRQDLKLALLDLDIYDKKFNAKEMIIYLENEIKQFVQKELE